MLVVVSYTSTVRYNFNTALAVRYGGCLSVRLVGRLYTFTFTFYLILKQAGGPLCLQIMFMKFDLDLPSIDDSVDVTSRHALGRCIVSTFSTFWTRPHVMNIDRHLPIDLSHRKQMGNQMLINL
jgi:hypothetical protein